MSKHLVAFSLLFHFAGWVSVSDHSGPRKSRPLLSSVVWMHFITRNPPSPIRFTDRSEPQIRSSKNCWGSVHPHTGILLHLKPEISKYPYTIQIPRQYIPPMKLHDIDQSTQSKYTGSEPSSGNHSSLFSRRTLPPIVNRTFGLYFFVVPSIGSASIRVFTDL